MGTPLMYAYTREYFDVADVIVNHPKAKSKIIWTKTDSKGRTITQLHEEATKKRAEMEIVQMEAKTSTVVSQPTPKRDFQQEMNDIYKASQQGKGSQSCKRTVEEDRTGQTERNY